MTLAEYRRKRGEPILPEGEGHGDAHAEHHPGALEYLQIGLILAVITAVEVGLYYIDMSHNLLVALLFMLSVIKFSLVVLWFMHLKFDSMLFRVAFLTGLVTAFGAFAVVLAVLRGQLV